MWSALSATRWSAIAVLKTGDTVVVAVSGRRRFVVPAARAASHFAGLGLTSDAAHLDHMVRGAESGEDARFVATQTRALGLQGTVEARDAASYRDLHRCSLEEAARDVRFTHFSVTWPNAWARVQWSPATRGTMRLRPSCFTYCEVPASTACGDLNPSRRIRCPRTANLPLGDRY